MMIYNALYSWAKHLQKEKHTQNPVDNVFIDVYNKFLKQKSAQKKTPDWVKGIETDNPRPDRHQSKPY